MTDKFKKLLETAADADKAELTMAHNGRVTAMKAYKDRPGKATKDDYDAARGMLDETVERLWSRYFPADAAAPEGERFKNRIQALNWLHAQGYKVSQGKFYQDCKSGFPGIHQDGSISRYQVMQYGQQLDVERRNSPENSAVEKEELEVRKLRAETEKRERENEDSRRENEDKWLHKHDAYAQLAALMGTLRDSLRHQFHAGQSHLIHLAGGDPARGPEVYEGADELISRAFNDVVNAGTVEAVFEEERE
jgi:hypothetical protein